MPSSEYKPGSILRVRCQNFLTYADVEFRPGPRLNMVLGPNGSGKSTILCAIALGLGGSPNLLGRGDDLKTFIMHEKMSAFVEVELKGKPTSKNRIVIRRQIEDIGEDKNAKSSYTLNGESITQKRVKEIVKDEFQISVDNLCTFLPQDHVGSFSGFDHKQLLIETEKALSFENLYKKHMDLIQMQGENSETSRTRQTIGERLKELRAENASLEKQRERIVERQSHVDRLELLEKKKLWLDMDKLRLQCVELKAEKERMKDAFNKRNEEIKPFQAKREELLEVKSAQGAKLQEEADRIKVSKKSLDKIVDKIGKYEENLDDSIVAIQEAHTRAAQLEQKARDYTERYEAAAEEISHLKGVELLEENMKDQMAKVKAMSKVLANASARKNSLAEEFAEIRNNERGLLKDMKAIRDGKSRRREKLFNALGAKKGNELRTICDFVDKNGAKLRHPVFGPIAAEVSCDNNTIAMCVEAAVPYRKSVCFITQCKEDFDFLFTEIRTKRKIPIIIENVNVQEPMPVEKNYSKTRVEKFRREAGIKGFLSDGIQAPPAVVEALKQVQLNNMLVGSSMTCQAIEKKNFLDELSRRDPGHPKGNSLQSSTLMVPGERQNSPWRRFTSIISKYSGKANMSLRDVLPSKLYSTGLPVEKIKEMEVKLADQKSRMEEIGDQMKEAEKEHSKNEKSYNGARNEFSSIKQEIAEIKRKQSKVETLRRKMEEARALAAEDGQESRKEKIREIKAYVTKSLKEQKVMTDQFDEMMEHTFSAAISRMGVDTINAQVNATCDVIERFENEAASFKQNYDEATEKFKVAKVEFKKTKTLAETDAPLEDAEGKDTPLRVALEGVTDDLVTLEALIDDCKNTINSIEDNPEVARQYEQRQEEIAAIERELGDLDQAGDIKQSELSKLEESWLRRLRKSLDKVDERFGKYMHDLGCAGGVTLYKAEEDGGEYKDYGIRINVRFREKAGMQVLSARVHSGGERSVSTILFLMALQDMLTSPVRCVDEINQGMDEVNERGVFKRIVENSCKPPERGDPSSHSGQYFLITPKLLPNLIGLENEEITVLTIFNGPKSFPNFSDWDVTRYLRIKRKLNSDTGRSGGSVEIHDLALDNTDENVSRSNQRTSTTTIAKKKRRTK